MHVDALEVKQNIMRALRHRTSTAIRHPTQRSPLDSLTSTSAGCSIANAIARAIALGGSTNFSRDSGRRQKELDEAV
jgi:hypothetical protein